VDGRADGGRGGAGGSVGVRGAPATHGRAEQLDGVLRRWRIGMFDPADEEVDHPPRGLLDGLVRARGADGAGDGGVVEADEMSHELLPPAPPHLREGPQGERVRDADERIDVTGEEARGRLGAVLETVLDPFDEIAGKTESAAGAEVAVKAVVARARALRPAEEADAGGALGGEGADGVIGPGAAVDVDPVVDLGGRGVLAPPGT